jgi:hypothetical protein
MQHGILSCIAHKLHRHFGENFTCCCSEGMCTRNAEGELVR